MAYWARQMQSQLRAWLLIANRYLAWIEILGEKTPEDVRMLDGLDRVGIPRGEAVALGAIL